MSLYKLISDLGSVAIISNAQVGENQSDRDPLRPVCWFGGELTFRSTQMNRGQDVQVSSHVAKHLLSTSRDDTEEASFEKDNRHLRRGQVCS